MSKLIEPHIAADRLKVCVRTIYRMIREGELEAIKIRSRWKIVEKSLENLLETKKQCTGVY